jgi:glycosyltransferase involved in cell wall biosynthesis
MQSITVLDPLEMNPSSQAAVPVSVVVPIKNEADNLPRCLESVLWADEIFVVDSGSTDDSAAVAERYGARVVQFHFNGTWPKKKNWALQTLPFRNEWVLILDADEVLPPAAGQEMADAIAKAGEICGYWINRRFFFLGRWLRHSYYPNWNLRLFRHSLGRYERLTDADTKSGDNEVHEHVIVQGPTARLRSEMDHYAFPSVDVFIEKHNRYSNWEARVAVDGLLPQSAEGLSNQRVERRRRLKLLSQRLPFRPLLRFLYIFVWQKGFLDGRDGYYFARLHATYEFLSVVKTYELRKRTMTKNEGRRTNPEGMTKSQ